MCDSSGEGSDQASRSLLLLALCWVERNENQGLTDLPRGLGDKEDADVDSSIK